MKNFIWISTILLILIVSFLIPTPMVHIVHAQTTCLDAAGNPIPCPPTDVPASSDNEDNNGAQPNNGDQNPSTSATVTTSPEPTATPLPIALPESDFLGSCTSENFTECKEQFECKDGTLVVKIDLYSGNGTKYDFYCIPHEKFPNLDLPIVLPADEGHTEDTNWGGSCSTDYDVDQCVEDFAAMCDDDGGDLSVWYDNEDGSAGVYCENSTPADNQPAPTEVTAIAAAPTDGGRTEGKNDWEDVCTFDSCLLLTAYCYWDGGTPQIVEDGSGNTGLHCNIPDEENERNISPRWWMLGALGIGIGVVILRKALNRRVEVKLAS